MKKQKLELEPSLIGGDLGNAIETARKAVAAGTNILHLDVMDGLFVPNFTIGPDIIGRIRENVPEHFRLDAHLMIYSPENFIEKFVKCGCEEITFHIEATEEVRYTIDYIKKCNRYAGLALKPETPVELVLPYLKDLDKVLIMTVEPGFGGQEFLSEMLNKVKILASYKKKYNLDFDIQVDGGINYETGLMSVKAGATRLVCGSFFYKQKDLKATADKFHSFEGEAL
ncbi:MAG: Ribulose-phosphate 3-epimerase [Chlamydiia bacterium]|nr:Ribulose-phosphate 3-epimerase [Chlamydiia bacterium]MCH9618698.1 Ribulose-phosphate 3-epimerase [Chlamydiia bacterium]